MSVEAHSRHDGKALIIRISGNFNFNIVNDFRSAYEKHSYYERYVIDMKAVESIDSSALGMLLNMERYLSGRTDSIDIVNCDKTIFRVFEIVRFKEKFHITEHSTEKA